MHAGDGEIVFDHFLSKPFHFGLSVAEDDGLGDGQAVIKVAKSVEFPLFFIDGNEELLNALESELVTFD